MATIGCGVRHKDKKNIKISAATTKQNNTETKRRKRQIIFQTTVKVTRRRVSHKVYTYYTRSIQQTAGKKKNYTDY